MTNDTPTPETPTPADTATTPATAGPADTAATPAPATPTAATAALPGYPAGGTTTLPQYPTAATATLPGYPEAQGPQAPQYAPAAAAPAYGTPVAPQPAQLYPPQPKTNVLGILTLVLGILGFGLIPVITGHIALSQIKKSGEDGRGITLAGLILGYVTLAGWLLVAFFWVAVAGFALIGAAASSY